MNRQEVLFEAIASSGIFLALGTASFLEDLRNDNSDPSQQVKMAKALGKKVILLIVSNLSTWQKDKLRTFFSDFDTVREVEIDPEHQDWGNLKVVLEELKVISKQ